MRLSIRATIVLCSAALSIGCFSVRPQAGIPADQKAFYVPAVDEELFGSWVIWGEPGPDSIQRLRLYPWGLVEGFAGISGPDSRWIGTSIIVDTWIGGQDEIWYREYRRSDDRGFFGGNSFVLDRVSEGGSVLETIYGMEGWPDQSEMGPGHPTYAKYRRQG